MMFICQRCKHFIVKNLQIEEGPTPIMGECAIMPARTSELSNRQVALYCYHGDTVYVSGDFGCVNWACLEEVPQEGADPGSVPIIRYGATSEFDDEEITQYTQETLMRMVIDKAFAEAKKAIISGGRVDYTMTVSVETDRDLLSERTAIRVYGDVFPSKLDIPVKITMDGEDITQEALKNHE